MENINQLTEKDVIEILSQREELLEGYRKRLEMLSREYEDAGELIEMLQLRSPLNDQEGSKSMDKKPYKAIITEGMSEQTINRLRKKAIQKIIHRLEKDNQAEQEE